MTRVAFRRCFPLVMVACLASAAETISGPIAGYLAESSRPQVRAIHGVPGAYGFSDPLSLPEGIKLVRLAPAQDFALVERSGASPAVLFLKDGAVDRMNPIDGAQSSADWVAFSPSAGSAMLFSSTGRLQVLRGLPDAPQVALDIDAASLPETPRIGAVSDDGTLALVASGRSLYRVTTDGARVILSAGDILSVAVLRNGRDVAVSDAGTGSIQLVVNAASSPESRVLASGLDGLGEIFPSADGNSLFVARPGSESMSSLDLASGAVRSFPAGVAPVRLTPMRNRDTFLISAEARQPGWVFYRNGTEARVVFIPAARMSAGEIPVRKGGKR